jgi:hypothetical protein
MHLQHAYNCSYFVIMDSDGVRTLLNVLRAFQFFIYLLIASFQCNDSNEDVMSLFKK